MSKKDKAHEIATAGNPAAAEVQRTADTSGVEAGAGKAKDAADRGLQARAGVSGEKVKAVTLSHKIPAPAADEVTFVSNDTSLDIIDIRVNGKRYRAKQGKDKAFLYWNVKAEDVASFSRHSHVIRGTIVRAD